MRVLELEVSNFMKLVAVHVAPKGSVIEVAGKNGAGKSTLLNAIKAAIGGGKLPEQPIRKGEKDSVIRVKLGEDKPTLIVTRKLSATEDGAVTTHLHLEGPNGERFTKPQTQLDALYGALTFDPFEFTRMDPDEQLETLRRFVPGVDFEQIAAANRGDFERRTEVNREIRSLTARLNVLTVPGDPRQQRVDEAALVAELEAAGTKAAEIERERARRQNLMRVVRQLAEQSDRRRQDVVRLDAEIAELEERLADMRQRKAGAEQDARTLREQSAKEQQAVEALPPVGAPPDTTDIKARIDAARKTNAEVSARERVMAEREQLTTSLTEHQQKAQTLTDQIAERDRQQAEAVAAAKLPIAGLGFAEDGVLFNGLPFANASTGEKLRVSVAIAAAMSPKLKVAGVRDASLLDDESRAQLEQLAEEYGFQLWVEVVRPTSDSGIVLEDGRVRGVQAEVAA